MLPSGLSNVILGFANGLGLIANLRATYSSPVIGGWIFKTLWLKVYKFDPNADSVGAPHPAAVIPDP